MSYREEQGYINLVKDIMEKGVPHSDRTGVGTRRILGETMKFDLSGNKIPLFTTKKVHWKSVVIELLWFLSGQTNINFLQKHGVRIWNEWADEDGELGPVYGEQFRFQASYDLESARRLSDYSLSLDPLENFIKQLKNNPDSRRHIISLWNAPLIPEMKLPPCHGIAIQASVINGGLYLEMYQRSCDIFLGVPFNVASYSLFTHMVAKELGLEAREFIWHGHDCHVYDNHHDQVALQTSREIREVPTLKLNYDTGYFFDQMVDKDVLGDADTDGIMNCFQLENYNPHPPIKAQVAV